MNNLLATSWVIIRLEDRETLFETFNPAIPAKLNTAKYVAIPYLPYIHNLNRQIKAGATGTVRYDFSLEA